MRVGEVIRLNAWAQLIYHDPEYVLPELRKIERDISDKIIDPKVRTLRTNPLRKHREGRVAALFAYGLWKCVIDSKVYFSPTETSDYDCIFHWQQGNTLHYTPVQLKEVISSGDTIRDVHKELNKLSKYVDSKDLVIGIVLNVASDVQKLSFDPNSLKVPSLNVSEVWVLGASKPDQSEWFLCGNLIDGPNMFEFSYPT